jgi:Na+:H+ antiporter, NhaA family
MREFLRSESSAGFALIAATLAGLIWANSPFAQSYSDLLHLKIGIDTNLYGVRLTAHEWINDGLMAVFFLLVALEIKRELLMGELSTFGRAALPAIAALGGILVPAAICAAFVWHDPIRVRGWAIPAATDIAFALAALTLVGRSVPAGLKVFLTALAVIDDLGAVVIIAVFYTGNLVLPALLGAAACAVLLVALNRGRVTWLAPYVVIGVVMWCCVLESGVHATVAGVVLAFTIPLEALKKLEHRLNPYVAFAILPVFGLFNAGISFRGLSPSVMLGVLPLGVACGLFFGKQVGIFATSWAAVKAGIAPLPHGVTWRMMYGVALIGGIGFTMSLFIGTLAFQSDAILTETKIGVFAGSIFAAIAGFLVLRGEKRAA